MGSMPIKIPLTKLVAAVESGALGRLEKARIPWKYRMTCAKLASVVVAEYQRFSKLRLEMVKKHNGKEIKPGTFTVAHEGNPPEAVQAFTDDMQQLLDTPLDLEVAPLSIEKLGDDCDLSVEDIRLLGPLLVETLASL